MITDTKQVGFIEDYKRILNDYYNIIDFVNTYTF